MVILETFEAAARIDSADLGAGCSTGEEVFSVSVMRE